MARQRGSWAKDWTKRRGQMRKNLAASAAAPAPGAAAGSGSDDAGTSYSEEDVRGDLAAPEDAFETATTDEERDGHLGQLVEYLTGHPAQPSTQESDFADLDAEDADYTMGEADAAALQDALADVPASDAALIGLTWETEGIAAAVDEYNVVTAMMSEHMETELQSRLSTESFAVPTLFPDDDEEPDTPEAATTPTPTFTPPPAPTPLDLTPTLTFTPTFDLTPTATLKRALAPTPTFTPTQGPRRLVKPSANSVKEIAAAAREASGYKVGMPTLHRRGALPPILKPLKPPQARMGKPAKPSGPPPFSRLGRRKHGTR